MPEPPRETQPRESFIFPISKEAVDKTLKRIEEDPEKALTDEALAVKNNPELGIRLQAHFTAHEEVIPNELMGDLASNSFMAGAYYGHAFIREQATQRGVEFPVFPEGFNRIHKSSILEEFEKDDHFSILRYMQANWDKLQEEEPELARGMREIARYSPYRILIYGGAGEVYRMFKGYSEAQKLEAKFGK